MVSAAPDNGINCEDGSRRPATDWQPADLVHGQTLWPLHLRRHYRSAGFAQGACYDVVNLRDECTRAARYYGTKLSPVSQPQQSCTAGAGGHHVSQLAATCSTPAHVAAGPTLVTDFAHAQPHDSSPAACVLLPATRAHTPSAYHEAEAEASGSCASGSGVFDSSEALMLHSSTAADPSTCHDYGGSSTQCAGLGSTSLCGAGEAGGLRAPQAAAPAAAGGHAGRRFWAAAARAFDMVHVQSLQEAAELAEAATVMMDSTLLSRLPAMPPVMPPCPPSPRPTEEAAPSGCHGGCCHDCEDATTSGTQLRPDLHVLWDRTDSGATDTELPRLWPCLLPDGAATSSGAGGRNGDSSCYSHNRSLISPATATARRYGTPTRLLNACSGTAAHTATAAYGGEVQPPASPAFCSPPESRVAGRLGPQGPALQPWQLYMRGGPEACGRHGRVLDLSAPGYDVAAGGKDAVCSFRHGHQYCVGEEVLLIVDVEAEDDAGLLRPGGGTFGDADSGCGVSGGLVCGGGEDWEAAGGLALDWSGGGRLARRLAGLRIASSGVAPRAPEWGQELLGQGWQQADACGDSSAEVALPPVAALVGLRHPQARPAGRLLSFVDVALGSE